MPTSSHVTIQTSSTPVASVNQAGEAMFGRPYVYREVYGYGVEQSVTVLTGNSSAVVAVVAFTSEHPRG